VWTKPGAVTSLGPERRKALRFSDLRKPAPGFHRRTDCFGRAEKPKGRLPPCIGRVAHGLSENRRVDKPRGAIHHERSLRSTLPSQLVDGAFGLSTLRSPIKGVAYLPHWATDVTACFGRAEKPKGRIPPCSGRAVRDSLVSFDLVLELPQPLHHRRIARMFALERSELLVGSLAQLVDSTNRLA